MSSSETNNSSKIETEEEKTNSNLIKYENGELERYYDESTIDELGEKDVSRENLAREQHEKNMASIKRTKIVVNSLLVVICIVAWCFVLRNIERRRINLETFQRVNINCFDLVLRASTMVLILSATFILMLDYQNLMFFVHTAFYSSQIVDFFCENLVSFLEEVSFIQDVVSRTPSFILYYSSILLLMILLFGIIIFLFRTTVKHCSLIITYTEFFRFRKVLFHVFFILFVFSMDATLFFLLRELKGYFGLFDKIFMVVVAFTNFIFIKCIIVVTVVKLLQEKNKQVDDREYKQVKNTDSFSNASLLNGAIGNSASIDIVTIEERSDGLFSILISVVFRLHSILFLYILCPLTVLKIFSCYKNTRIHQFFQHILCYDIAFTAICEICNETKDLKKERKKVIIIKSLFKSFRVYTLFLPFVVFLVSFLSKNLSQNMFEMWIVRYSLFRIGIILMDFIYTYCLFLVYYGCKDI